MDKTLAQKAVDLAISGKWDEALMINLEIIKNSPEDVDALNRLARCYAEIEDLKKATETTQKVLKIDPSNPIAIKCLERWENTKKGTHKSSLGSADAFLEEPGKTKLLELSNLGEASLISSLNSGDNVKLVTSAHKVSIVDYAGKYVGRFSDDIAMRLRNLIKSGAKYQTIIKSASHDGVSVFVREIENKSGIASFPQEKIDYVTFTPPELVHHDIPETSSTEEIID